ncbi:hypothetical protein [Desulfofundulus salinus]|uniref:hypothetical protein n=1 Tax=Desulfofundulus salinus TaxID=2419843 RepID=UPI001403BF16|nr:hypothetical protein [Desulfofundulus salinum]
MDRERTYRLLDSAVAVFVQLEKDWDEELAAGYPFRDSLDELIIRLVDWRDSFRE